MCTSERAERVNTSLLWTAILIIMTVQRGQQADCFTAGSGTGLQRFLPNSNTGGALQKADRLFQMRIIFRIKSVCAANTSIIFKSKNILLVSPPLAQKAKLR